MAEWLQAGAEFSVDRLHRYRLWRVWKMGAPRLTFVGLNPSTADGLSDDATLRKLSTLARRHGYGRLDVVNAYSRIETDSRLRYQHADVDRDDTWLHFSAAVQGADAALGWGRGVSRERALWLCQKHLPQTLLCFAQNMDGSPKHPLYLPNSSELKLWGGYG